MSLETSGPAKFGVRIRRVQRRANDQLRTMPESSGPGLRLHADVYERALDARDARFDGLFFVGITSTRIYCRPVCPARVCYSDHRRFFDTAASAERAGYRPCLRCRPELAPGRALCDAVSRLARTAALRIGAGALNGRAVSHLANDLGVSERHLRRALEREIGVSPVELAQTHRLLLAKRLLADTALSVTHVAFASGFQSLRRFNVVFRERYRMSPSALRREPRTDHTPSGGRTHRMASSVTAGDLVRLTLSYRAPFNWEVLLRHLAWHAVPGVEVVDGARYGRTVSLEGRHGVLFAEDAAQAPANGRRAPRTHLNVDISQSLLPVLMPLLARLRQLFDLDAEPTVVDAHLEESGLGELVQRRRGVRIPGAIDGFDVALQALLIGAGESSVKRRHLAQHIATALGEPIDTGVPALHRLAPNAARVAEAGVRRLTALGVSDRSAGGIVAVARAVAERTLHLTPGSDADATHRALTEIAGASESKATIIVMRALCWPDAFPAFDRALQRSAGVGAAHALRDLAEQWRPWRAYAALHLWLHDEQC